MDVHAHWPGFLADHGSLEGSDELDQISSASSSLLESLLRASSHAQSEPGPSAPGVCTLDETRPCRTTRSDGLTCVSCDPLLNVARFVSIFSFFSCLTSLCIALPRLSCIPLSFSVSSFSLCVPYVCVLRVVVGLRVLLWSYCAVLCWSGWLPKRSRVCRQNACVSHDSTLCR